jgi:hypothetical protein
MLKTRHWFIVMRRHALLAEQVAFYTINGPYTFARMVAREAMNGKFSALKRLIHGPSDPQGKNVERRMGQ